MSNIVEQYKILWDQLSGEMNRFWIRYNVLLGVQVAIVIGVLKPLLEDHLVRKYAFLPYLSLTLIALVTLLIGFRAIKTYELNIEGIKKFEQMNIEEVYLLTKLSTSLDEDKKIDVMRPVAYKLAMLIPMTLFAIWSIALVNEIAPFI